MIRKMPVILLLVAVGFFGCGDRSKKGQGEAEKQPVVAVDAAADSLDKMLDGDLPPAEKLSLIVKFLEDYPQSKYTVDLVEDAFYCQGQGLGDMAGAVAFAEKMRGKIGDPALALEFDRSMLVFYNEAGMTAKMIALAGKLHDAGSMKFMDYFFVSRCSAEVGEWAIAREFCSRASVLADTAVYRKDYPDRSFTDEQVEKAVKNRRAMLLVVDSWARANIGEINEAIAGFGEARESIRRSYIDIPAWDLDYYWAKTLMMKGDFEEAAERFAPAALIMRNEDAIAGLREAYIRSHLDESGYGAFAADLHRKIAKTINDFELPDFGGTRRTYSSLKGDVTLLVFWSPT